MFCSKCGTKIEDDSVFCSECGSKVDPIIKPASEVKAEEEAKKKAEEEAKKKAEEEAKKKAEEEAKKKAEEEAKKKAEEEAKKKAEEEAKKKAEEEAKKKAEEEAKKKAEEEAKKKAEEEAKKKAEASKPVGNPILGSGVPAGNPILGSGVPASKPVDNKGVANVASGNPVLGGKIPNANVLGNAPESKNAKAPESKAVNTKIEDKPATPKKVEEPKFVYDPEKAVGALNKINFDEEDLKKEPEAPVTPTIKQEETVKPAKKKSALPIVILIVIIFLLIGVGAGAGYYFLVMDKNPKTEEIVEETENEEDKEDSKKKEEKDEEKDKEKEEVVEEKVDVKAIYDDFMAGNITASYEGTDYLFSDWLTYLFNHDSSFTYDIAILGHDSVKYAVQDFDGDDTEELILETITTTGLEIGNPAYTVVKYNDDKLEIVNFVEAYPAPAEEDERMAEFAGISFNDVNSGYWTKITVNQDAMQAYRDYLQGNVKDNMDKTINDVLGDNHIKYYYILAKENDIPLLVFRDSEEKFPAAIVVYYNDMIVRSVFFEKWTFTTVEEGSVGGMYNNCVYTSKSPWGLDEGCPKDMVFYTVDLNTFMTTATNKAVILASEGDFNGVGKYSDYESYMNAVNKEFSTDEYKYYYTDGDSYTDDDGNVYDSFEAICRIYGSDANYTLSQWMDLN